MLRSYVLGPRFNLANRQRFSRKPTFTMALILANALMSAPRTNEDSQELVTLYTGQDAVRAGMMEYCTNVSN